MELETLKKELFTHVDDSIKSNVAEIAGPLVAEKVANAVAEARAQDVIHGRKSLADSDKKALSEDIRRIAANEKAAYLTVNDQTGGYLVPQEVHGEIMRIAETTGIVARDAARFGATDLDIPIYTGSAMQGSYVGEDAAGSETQNDLGVARLKAAEWMNIIRLSNKLIAKANVNVADWLMGLVAEGLAYRFDREGFVGGTYAGSPFVGLLQSADVTTQTLASTLSGFEDLTVEEASEAIGTVATAALSGAAFYFSPSVWAQIRVQKSGSEYVFQQNYSNLATLRRENGIQPVGEILGYPVYTTNVLPNYSASAASTKFGVFGNLKLGLAIGDSGPMQMARSENAVVNSVSVFERNQTAMRFTHSHAISVMLPAAVVVLKTAA
jgi:HK97 family phage major capsid protein